MSEEEKLGWSRGGLKLRYGSRAVTCRGLISAAPWIDVILIMVFFFLAGSRLVLYPGTILKLPVSGEVPALRPGVTAVILSHESGDGGRREVVFFDDESFVVESMDGLMGLVDRFAAAASNHVDTPLLIQADVNVRHGTVGALCEVARAAGFKEVGLVMRQPEDETDE
jgi:biopolymer transport protein ExbD